MYLMYIVVSGRNVYSELLLRMGHYHILIVGTSCSECCDELELRTTSGVLWEYYRAQAPVTDSLAHKLVAL